MKKDIRTSVPGSTSTVAFSYEIIQWSLHMKINSKLLKTWKITYEKSEGINPRNHSGLGQIEIFIHVSRRNENIHT